MSAHLQLPLRLAADGSLATHPEDSDAELQQSVRLVLTTRVGERAAAPEFGSPSPFPRGFAASGQLEAVERWEPRASPEVLSDVLDGAGLQDVLLAVGEPEQ